MNVARMNALSLLDQKLWAIQCWVVRVGWLLPMHHQIMWLWLTICPKWYIYMWGSSTGIHSLKRWQCTGCHSTIVYKMLSCKKELQLYEFFEKTDNLEN